jgi:hypothetical protein
MAWIFLASWLIILNYRIRHRMKKRLGDTV